MPDWLQTLTSLTALITSLVGLYLLITRFPLEKKKLTADTSVSNGTSAKAYSEAAQNYAEEVVKLQKQIAQMELDQACEVEKLNQEIISLKTEQARMSRRQIELEAHDKALVDWADRLCHQIYSLNGVPVKMQDTIPLNNPDGVQPPSTPAVPTPRKSTQKGR